MKIVQSFWSKPHREATATTAETRLYGGWPEKKFYYMSWAFSCLQLNRHYDRVELVTDAAGYDLLIDKLKLPYTRVAVSLDALDAYPTELWALGKIFAYRLQREPFVHVDSDLFIWEKLPAALTAKPLITQHLELGYPFYNQLYTAVHGRCDYLPECISGYCSADRPINAYNMGIAGGNDIAFFQQYAEEAFRFVNRNRDFLSQGVTGAVNTLFEQVLFYCMSQAAGKTVGLYTEDTGEDVVDPQFKGLDSFCKAPEGVGLIHLYGNCKMDPRYGRELESKLKRAYPAYHRRILELEERHAAV